MNARALFADGRGHAAATCRPGFLGPRAADELLRTLIRERSAFRSGFMIVGDVWVKTPRLVAEFGDGEHVFPDTGPNRVWPDELRALRDRLEADLGEPFNYAIANWYRDGRDFTGWHADKMDLHRPGSSIAMVSVGVERTFEFRRAADGVVVSTTAVGHGSLLVMHPTSQVGYEHSLRPDPSLVGPRLSLTFRQVLPTNAEPCCSSLAGGGDRTT